MAAAYRALPPVLSACPGGFARTRASPFSPGNRSQIFDIRNEFFISVSRAEHTRLRIGLDGGNAVANPSPTLTIVVPCYNEEEVLPETARRLDMLIVELINDNCIAVDSHVCFVDDGSTDRTWAIIRALRESSARFGGIRLSRNRGHQIALMAGLLAAPGDIMISVDADLQDDLNAIRKMLDVAAAGADIVYGVSSARTTDTMIKRLTAHLYYHLLRLLSVEIIFDHADFRLMTRRAVDALRQYEESNLFLRALVPLLGFKSSTVLYERTERWAGTSKYPIGKMLGLALEGITSFSTRPLRLVTILGFGISCLAFIIAAWAIFATIVMKTTIPGWASTVIPIYLICGVQLLCVRVIGEYVGKIYLETKRRPRSHVLERLEPRSPSSCGSPTARASHGETTPIFAQFK